MNHATLETFIAKRMAELDQLEEPLVKLLTETQAKLTLIGKEKEMLLRAIEAAGLKTREIKNLERGSHTQRPKKIHGKTLKEATLEILARNKIGLSAADILKELNATHGTDFDRSSLSPQISRLRQEGHLELTGRIWHLKGQLQDLQSSTDLSKKPEEGDLFKT